MERPETPEAFLEKLLKLKIAAEHILVHSRMFFGTRGYITHSEIRQANCISCGDAYPFIYNRLTEQRCPSCAMEILYGYSGLAIEEVFIGLKRQARREIRAKNSLAFRQQLKLRELEEVEEVEEIK